MDKKHTWITSRNGHETHSCITWGNGQETDRWITSRNGQETDSWITIRNEQKCRPDALRQEVDKKQRIAVSFANQNPNEHVKLME